MPVFLVRFALWISFAAAAFLADVLTKIAPHDVVAHHYARTPTLIFVFVGILLCALGVTHSRALAIGSGLMFGGLCGNAEELLLRGYASDWVPIGHWLTNVADLCAAFGLLWCVTSYLMVLRR